MPTNGHNYHVLIDKCTEGFSGQRHGLAHTRCPMFSLAIAAFLREIISTIVTGARHFDLSKCFRKHRLARRLDTGASTPRRIIMARWFGIEVFDGFISSFLPLALVAFSSGGCSSDKQMICTEHGCVSCYGNDCRAFEGSGDSFDGSEGRAGSAPSPGQKDSVGGSSGTGGNGAAAIGGSGGMGGSSDTGGMGGNGGAGGITPDCVPSTIKCVCGDDGACDKGLTCLDGLCLSACEFSSQCKAGMICLNGKCVVGCDTTSPCQTGYVCNDLGICEPDTDKPLCDNEHPCGASMVCVKGICKERCKTQQDCKNDEICDWTTGVCIENPEPTRPCEADPSVCVSTQVCEQGYCRYSCEADSQCKLIDARIPTCKNGICMSAREADPECVKQSDCPTGKQCVSNVCK